MTLPANTPAKIKITTRIADCFPPSTVQILSATYQVDSTTGQPYCLVNGTPRSRIQVTPSKRPATGGQQQCAGAGAVTCYPGEYAPDPYSTSPLACTTCGTFFNVNYICTVE